MEERDRSASTRAEAAPAADAGRCPNCRAEAEGRFCPACGQRQGRRLASIREMAAGALSDQFSLDATLPRTLAGLARPGFLTTEYLDGRIVRYIPPLRLYLVCSLAFFFLLSWRSDPVPPPEAVAAAAGIAEGAGEPSRPVSIDLEIGRDTAELPGWQRPIARRLRMQAQRLEGMSPEELTRRFLAGLREQAPRAVFVLVPVFALLLAILYLRRGRLLAEHLVFSLHVHAVAFLLFTLMLLIPGATDALVVFPLFLAYLFAALRRVYRQSVAKTALKYALLVSGYGAALFLVLVLTALVTAFTV